VRLAYSDHGIRVERGHRYISALEQQSPGFHKNITGKQHVILDVLSDIRVTYVEKSYLDSLFVE